VEEVMSDNKTHYRKVFKSDHLGVADLEDLLEEGKTLVFTIKHVKQELKVRVAGKVGDFNIAYFKENIKPWVVNAGNGKILKKFAGGSPYVEDWNNIPVTLFIDPNVKLKGDMVGGVRINPTQPKIGKTELLPSTPAWANAIAAYKRDGNLDKVEARMTISAANKTLLIDEATNGVG
jgi:hypothetical protein